jgi:uncharacterized protein YhdP
VVLQDAQARDALRLQRVVVALSPRSLLNLGMEQLYIEGPQLEVRRDATGRLWVAGLEVSPATGEASPAANWFFRQKEVVVLGGALRWVDEQRSAPPLVLTDVRFVARNGPRRHALRLDASPPADWGGAFTLMGELRSPLLSQHPGRWQDWQGELHADFSAVDLSRLRPYANLGVDLRSGQGRLRAWADLDRGRLLGGQAEIDLRQVDAVLVAGRPPLALESVAGRLIGKRLGQGFQLETQALQFQTPDGQRWPGGNLSLAWEPAAAKEPGRGRLRADRLDLQALTRLADRLPLTDEQRGLLAQIPRGPDGLAGLIERLDASWELPATAPAKYKVSARASGLVLPADPASRRPGLRGVTLQGEFDQVGGKAHLEAPGSVLSLPGVLAEPQVGLDRLVADLQWKRSGQRRPAGRGSGHLAQRRPGARRAGQPGPADDDRAGRGQPGLALPAAVAAADARLCARSHLRWPGLRRSGHSARRSSGLPLPRPQERRVPHCHQGA